MDPDSLQIFFQRQQNASISRGTRLSNSMVVFACNDMILDPSRVENDASLSRLFVFPCPVSGGKTPAQEAAIRRINDGQQFTLFLQSIGRDFDNKAGEVYYARLSQLADVVKSETGEPVHDDSRYSFRCCACLVFECA